MKKIYATRNPKDPSLVDFYVDGERIENMYCQPGVRSGGNQIEATARVVAVPGTGIKEGASHENNSAAEEGIHLQTEREPESSNHGTGENDIQTTKRNRKKVAEAN